MTWLNNVTWPKVVLLIVVILIVTRIVAPDTAQWIITPIVDLSRAAIQAIRDFGGTP